MGASRGDWRLWGLQGPDGLPPIPSGKAILQARLPVTDDRAVCLGLFLGLPRDSLPAHETEAAEAAGETRRPLTGLRPGAPARVQCWPRGVILKAEAKGTAAEVMDLGPEVCVSRPSECLRETVTWCVLLLRVEEQKNNFKHVK